VESVIAIRKLRDDEWDAAGAATAEAYVEHEPGDGSWGGYLRRIADVATRSRRALVLVAEVDGTVAGTATLELDQRIDPASSHAPLAADEAHLRMVGVVPSMRRRGIGRRLVLAAIAAARDHGKTRMTLDTTAKMTAAQRMYQELGFRFTGRSERIPGVDLLMYELDLHGGTADADV
jgi:ribosomal protein S18 acetylase RimI-like enzyme